MESALERRVKAAEIDFDDLIFTRWFECNVPRQQGSTHQAAGKTAQHRCYEGVRSIALAGYAAAMIPAKSEILDDIFFEAVHAVLHRDRDSLLDDELFIRYPALRPQIAGFQRTQQLILSAVRFAGGISQGGFQNVTVRKIIGEKLPNPARTVAANQRSQSTGDRYQLRHPALENESLYEFVLHPPIQMPRLVKA